MKRFLAFMLVLSFLISCKSDPPPRPVSPPPVAQPKPEPVPPPVEEPVVIEEPVIEAPITEIPIPEVETVEVPEPPSSPPVAEAFDPSTISQEQKDTAKSEIQQLIQRLNGIIRAKDYNSWVTYLDGSYFTAINSPEYLERVSKSPVLVKQKVVLNSAQDYFNHVVVPSRTNDRVDDIEFVSQNRVKAYTVNNAGNKLRLYDLEKSVTGWKIIN
jgi:hypothetical protein